MYKIELSIPATMSLLVNSTSGSEDIDVESLSDEEFSKLSEEEFAAANSEEDREEENDEEEESNESLGDGEEEDFEEEANEEDESESAEDDESEEAELEDETDGNQPSEEEQSQNNQAYEDVYNELFGQPIKASGREVQLRDVTQVRNLVEMGVDYNKKMQHMRPHMQTLKTLEKEGLLGDEEQLNLLLEAKQGKPEAIRRLIADANIDMLDMADDEDFSGYRPENHIITAQEVEVEEAFSAIQGTASYDKTIDVMTKSFDPKSREIMSANPDYIKSLNQDIESGIYDKVMDMVQYQRDVNAIPSNVSDIEAYIGTVQQLAAQEQADFNQQQQLEQQQASQQNTRRSNGASRKQKTAMSGSRGSKKKEQNFDPMAAMEMSDDEFMKRYGNKIL